ncbi:MAG: sterol desaturase family protein [Deltaproteobacteria bacterium]|nr:sterol desaturase family protein [Deltaproteobacteria bacterium]
MTPGFGALAVGLLVLGLAFGLLERLAPARPKQRWLRAGIGTDLVYWFFTPLVTKTLTRFTIVLALVLAAVAAGVPLERSQLEAYLRPSGPLAELPWLVQLAALLLVSDLLAYGVHRLFHRRALWRFHAVHHSSTQVDWLSSVRLHPVNDALTRMAQAVPIVLLGFDPTILAAYVPILTVYALFVHANVPWSFGPLRFVVASPAFHRWHHAAEEDGLNRNFAGLFPFIDLLFGTFHMPRDRAPARFGIPDGDVPEGIVAQLAWPFRPLGSVGVRFVAAQPYPGSCLSLGADERQRTGPPRCTLVAGACAEG